MSEKAMTDWTAIPEEVRKELVGALAEYDHGMEAIGGCGDGGCVVFRRKGMHTNGGCRCYEDRTTARQAMARSSYFAHRIRAILEGRRP